MNNRIKLISSAVLIATSAYTFAAQDATDIDIQVTKDVFVQLTGTAVGSSSSFITDDIDGATVSLGTLGLESNSAGQCAMSFSTVNGFSLNHDATNNPLTTYSLAWNSHSFNSNITFTDFCNIIASDLQMTAGTLPTTIDAGTYSDIVTVTVVTQ